MKKVVKILFWSIMAIGTGATICFIMACLKEDKDDLDRIYNMYRTNVGY